MSGQPFSYFVEVHLVKRQFFAAIVSAAVCFVANTATAQINWNGSVSADAAVGANWDGGTAPGSGANRGSWQRDSIA